jgi:hypothetical protein
MFVPRSDGEVPVQSTEGTAVSRSLSPDKDSTHGVRIANVEGSGSSKATMMVTKELMSSPPGEGYWQGGDRVWAEGVPEKQANGEAYLRQLTIKKERVKS